MPMPPPSQREVLHVQGQISIERKVGQRGVFFSLEYNEADIIECFAAVGEDATLYRDRFEFDNADAISAPYIIRQLESAARGTVVVVDYLQLLDQKRDNPTLTDQVAALKAFARERELILVFISQIDRSYDASQRKCPELVDVRLPNPLDLALFDKACFLHDGEMTMAPVG